MTLQRAYYHCSHCEHGVFPRDRAFGMEHGTLSPGAARMTDAVAGLNIGARQVELSAEVLGMEIACDGRSRVEGEPASAATMCPGMDGTGVLVRAEERRGRPGKQADGSSKTREVKLAVVFTADGRHYRDTHRGD